MFSSVALGQTLLLLTVLASQCWVGVTSTLVNEFELTPKSECTGFFLSIFFVFLCSVVAVLCFFRHWKPLLDHRVSSNFLLVHHLREAYSVVSIAPRGFTDAERSLSTSHLSPPHGSYDNSQTSNSRNRRNHVNNLLTISGNSGTCSCNRVATTLDCRSRGINTTQLLASLPLIPPFFFSRYGVSHYCPALTTMFDSTTFNKSLNV